jgi:hypothetical protein
VTVRKCCVALALLLTACGRCGGSGDEPGGDTHTPRPAPVAPHGTVIGHVTFAPGDAGLPYYPDYMIPTPAAPAPPPEDCPHMQAHVPVRMDEHDRGLVGVMIAATEFDRTHPPHADPTHRDVEIRDCSLTPMLVVANVGDTIVVTNRSSYPYFPSVTGYGGTTMAAIRDQPPREFSLDHPGITQLGCGSFGVQCGRADVIVLQNPAWAVTTTAGAYRIENVPPGDHVEIHAWHPLFAEAMERIDLHDGETKTVDLVLRAAPLPPPPEDAGTPTHDPNQIGDIH